MAPAPVPEVLPDGDCLCGSGDRAVKLGFITVTIYRAAFFVDAPKAAALFDAAEAEEPRPGDFFTRLVQGQFRKTFEFTFLRALPEERVRGGFREQLQTRIPATAAGDADQLIKAVPQVQEGEHLAIRFAADGEVVEVFGPGASTEGLFAMPPALSLRSRDVWLAFQRIYFDEDTAFPAIRTGAIARLPAVLRAAALTADVGAAAQDAPVSPRPPLQSAGAAVLGCGCAAAAASLGDALGAKCLVCGLGSAQRGGGAVASAPTAAAGQLVGDADPLPPALSATSEAVAAAATKAAAAAGAEFELRFEVVEAADLVLPKYRFGDLTSGLLRGEQAARLSAVYVELKFAGRSCRTAPAACTGAAEAPHRGVSFDNELHAVLYNGEQELLLSARDERGVQAAIRGDPLIGEARVTLKPKQVLRDGQMEEMLVQLHRDGARAGSVLLRYQLRPGSTVPVDTRS